MIVASNGEPRDGTKFYFEWVVYSKYRIQLPKTDVLWNEIDPPQLHEGVRSIEARITPFKIYRPREVQEATWMHGNIESYATEVSGERGHYLLLETLRQN